MATQTQRRAGDRREDKGAEVVRGWEAGATSRARGADDRRRGIVNVGAGGREYGDAAARGQQRGGRSAGRRRWAAARRKEPLEAWARSRNHGGRQRTGRPLRGLCPPPWRCRRLPHLAYIGSRQHTGGGEAVAGAACGRRWTAWTCGEPDAMAGSRWSPHKTLTGHTCFE